MTTNEKSVYIAPIVETIEIAIENGFAQSGEVDDYLSKDPLTWGNKENDFYDFE